MLNHHADKIIADEILSTIFKHLGNHRFVMVCAEVCKPWRRIVNYDSIWKDLCVRLWTDKVVVPDSFRSLLNSGRSKEAYVGSLFDSKRVSITVEELSSCKFYFRFKRVAGSYWTEKDPFWTEDKPMSINFSTDGSVSGFPWDALQFKWHFVDNDGRAGVQTGSAMRVAVNGRCVPTYTISRHSNWGFIIQVLILLNEYLIAAPVNTLDP
jgi:hypothetical protein